MPLFEYKCKNCDTKYEVLHKSAVKQEEVACPKCHSTESKKLFSAFSASIDNSGGYSGSSCATGNCEIPASGGCASGMCGLN
ncbi:MAG: zinc ribbon domain-containing protein [Ignavibacteriaceae bacterium]